MSKSLDFDFIGLYRALLKDIALHFPTDQKGFDRDLQRIISLSSSRGPLVFARDLPDVGKLFDKALSSGRLVTAGEPLTRSAKRKSMIPRLFQGLWMRCFDEYGCLKQDIDPNVVLFLRTLLYVGKNFDKECAPSYLFKATKEFYNVDSQVPPPSHHWDGDGLDLPSPDVSFADFGEVDQSLFGNQRGDLSTLLATLQHVADRVSSSFGTFNSAEAGFRHGPGAVADLQKGSYKYSFPSWSERIATLFPYDQFGMSNLAYGDSDLMDGIGPDTKEYHSVLIAVPKTLKGPRLIAKEPTCHQWIQQGIARYLHQAVRSSHLGRCIDFRSQTPSRMMALVASRDGAYATIDLKSASDRISCQLVERLFRKNPTILAPMIASRTRYIYNPIDKREEKLWKLHKFSTQGSALTFPTQSILFACVCLAAGADIKYGKRTIPRNGIRSLCRQVRIFGDDLIVPKEWEPRVRELLTVLGLKVNDTKTHSSGFFRESCGMDAYRGYDVTPAYVRKPFRQAKPGTLASVVEVSNNFYKKGFWHTASWIESTIPSGMLVKLPITPIRRIGEECRGSGTLGLHSFSGTRLPRRSRWNEGLQRMEYRTIFASVKKGTERRHQGAANLLQYFTEKPAQDNDFCSGQVAAPSPVIREGWRAFADVMGT